MGEILPKFGIFRATYTIGTKPYIIIAVTKKKTVTGHL
jgi:hypothetical protein